MNISLIKMLAATGEQAMPQGGMDYSFLIMMALIFLIFYLPLRIPYLMEERTHLSTRRDWLFFFASILTVMIPAIVRLS